MKSARQNSIPFSATLEGRPCFKISAERRAALYIHLPVDTSDADANLSANRMPSSPVNVEINPFEGLPFKRHIRFAVGFACVNFVIDGIRRTNLLVNSSEWWSFLKRQRSGLRTAQLWRSSNAEEFTSRLPA